MPMQGATDVLRAKVKFPKERTDHGTVVVVAVNPTTNAAGIAAYSGNSTFTVVSATNLANGYIVQAYANANIAYMSTLNIGNNTPVVSGGSGVLGFNQVGANISNIQGSLITLTSAFTANIPNGSLIWFSKPFNYKPNVYANTYNANTYLVTTTRTKNANSILHSSHVHPGWNYVQVGTGYIKSAQVAILSGNAVGGNQYGATVNGFLTITANTLYPGGTGANVQYFTNANGSIVYTIVNSNGSGYVLTPTVTAPFSGNISNAVNSIFNVVMGGRANRIQVETLSVVANAVASDPASGGIWFPGV